MQILQHPISRTELAGIARNTFGDMVKAVADVKRSLIAVDADLHADLERLLLEDGSAQEDLWGFNLWVEEEGEDFIEYLQSVDRSPSTITQYKHDLDIFWVWNLQNNDNKEFIKITKREFARFQNHCLNEWGWSPNRIRRVKSVISSMSNFIENILDDEEEFKGYRSMIKKIESPVKEFVREKTVLEEDELNNLLNTLVEKGEIMKAAVVALAAFSGARKSEIPRFKFSYFDQENVIFGSLYKTPEKIKTKGRGRGKFINLYTLKNEFDPYLNLWRKERERLNIDSEWLFPNVGDIGKEGVITEPLHTSTMDGWCEEFSRIVGRPWYWHLNRHYRTTLLLKKNIPS